MDNILLSLVAPDFVTIEVLFMLGWRSDVNAKCQKRIDANIAEFRRQQTVKSK